MKRTVIVLGVAAMFVGAMGPFSIRAQSGVAKPQTAAQPAPAQRAPQANRINFEKDIAPILATHCTGCHSGPKPRGAMNLAVKDENEARARLKDDDTFWERVETEVSTKQMPPAGRKPPTDAQRELLAEWIFNNVMTLDGKPDPGPFMVRRLNNREYANTVRDLLYLPPTFDVDRRFSRRRAR